MSKELIILSDEIAPPTTLVRGGIEVLPAAIAGQCERAGRRFIEFFTANIRNRNTRMAYARAVKQFFDGATSADSSSGISKPLASRRTSNNSAPKPASRPRVCG